MAQTTPNQPVDTRPYRTSWRLTFRFDGERIDLVRQERLQKIAPGTTPAAPIPGKNSGTWLALVDPAGQVLFHRLLHDPLRTRAEHHSPDGRIELHLRDPQPGEFTALLPDIPAAAEVRLYASPTDHERMHEPAREIGRYPLRPPGRDDDPSSRPPGGPQEEPPARPGKQSPEPRDDQEAL